VVGKRGIGRYLLMIEELMSLRKIWNRQKGWRRMYMIGLVDRHESPHENAVVQGAQFKPVM